MNELDKFKKMAMPDDKVVNEAFDRIRLMRQNFLLDNPFFSILALRQELVEASNWLPTMGVDGKHFFFNANFVLALTIEQLKFCVTHEILHLAYGHLERAYYGNNKERDHNLFNQACDYCVNRDIVNAGIGEMPEFVLYDKQYEKNVAEEIYEMLLKEPEKNKKNQSFDEHIDLSGNNGSAPPNIKKDKNGNNRCFGKPSYGTKDVDQNMASFKDDLMIAHDQVANSKNAGSIPGDLQRIINEMRKPRVNWRHYLKKMIQSQLNNDLNWSRCSRKAFDSRFHFPGEDKDNLLSIHISIDTSGSMSTEMLTDFLSEVYGITKQFENFIIRVWTFDTQVYNMKEFTPDNAKELKKYNVRGNGGTDFMVNWEYMKEKKIKPDLFVMFTDGMPCGDWGVPKYCDTLYVVHTHPNNKAPSKYGKTIHYEAK